MYILIQTFIGVYTSNNTYNKIDDLNNIRIMQFNVEWLYIDYFEPADCPGNGCPWANISEANIHMEHIISVINELKPNLVNFCEIEGINEMNIIKNNITNNYNTYLIKGTDTSTGQNVGLMTNIPPTTNLYRTDMKTNYPIENSNCNSSINGTTGVSKHYITELNINNLNIAMIGAHLLSMPTDPDRCSKREAQSIILQSIIYDYIIKKYEILLIGDFNDFDNDIYDINNNKPISKVIDILKGNSGTYAGKYSLNTVAINISQQERYTNWWDSDNNCNTSSINDYSMIDHILVSNILYSHITNAFIFHSYNEYCGKYNSDHYPIIIDLII